MAFRFRLEKVVMVRQEKVDRQSRRVGEAQRQMVEIQQALLGLEQQIHLLVHPGSAGDLTQPQDLLARRRWLDLLDRRRAQMQARHEQARKNWEDERTLLTEAWRDLEVLKKLKQRQKEAWMAEQVRRENRELDEIGQLRADQARREKLATSPEQHSRTRGHCRLSQSSENSISDMMDVN